MTGSIRRIVIVCPTLLDRDAVGGATAGLYRDLSDRPGWKATIIARRNDRTDTPAEIVSSLGDMLMSDSFREADLIVYVFAIYNELFDAMLIGNGHARQVVRFHNVTPRAFVKAEDYDVIDRSIDQLQNLDCADEIWADSQENRDELQRRKIASGKVCVLPLSVQPLVRKNLATKDPAKLSLLYVGRFVPSKGLHDLILALAVLKARGDVPFAARLVGNLRHAPREYVLHLRELIKSSDLVEQVSIEGPVDEPRLADAYASAHLLVTASRHEGFCLPVVEGLAAGCVPVTYRNSNLQHIAGGLGRLAIEDTPEALATAMHEIGAAIASGEVLPLDRGAASSVVFDKLAAEYVSSFDPVTCRVRMRHRVSALLGETTDQPVPHVAPSDSSADTLAR